MDEHVIDFRDIDWQQQRPGVRFKARTQGSNTLRLVEFSDRVVEEDWCTKGHIGYVLEGKLIIDFEQSTSQLRKGDGLYIAEGTKHRASLPEGESAVVIFVEKA